jgi:hypothetical protein
MKLRDHPLMSYRGIRNWPPVWTLATTRKGIVTILTGEVGVLRYVHSNILMSNKCFVAIDFQEETYIGSLIFKDHAFCRQISHLLRDHVGRSIKNIGDLDVSYLLQAGMKFKKISTQELAKELMRTSREILERTQMLRKENARLRAELRNLLK